MGQPGERPSGQSCNIYLVLKGKIQARSKRDLGDTTPVIIEGTGVDEMQRKHLSSKPF